MNQILASDNNEGNKKNVKEEIESLDYSAENTNYNEDYSYDDVDDFEPVNNFNDYEANDYNNDYSSNYSNDYSNDYTNDYSNNYSNNDSKGTKNTDMKKIVIIFAIAILILGLVIVGIIAINYAKNKAGENTEPEITMNKTEEGTALTLSVSYKKGISKIIYYWNDEQDEAQTIESTGDSVSKLIEIPKGENKLTVVIYDKNNETKTYNNTFENNIDNEKPTLELSIVEDDASLKIVATDETKMDHIEYYWGEDSAKNIYPDETDALTIEKNIEIQRGKNTLTVVAVDAAGNKTEEQKQFNGVNKPELDIYVQNEYVYITISHDIGIKSIKYKINGKEYTFDENSSRYEEDKLMVYRKVKLIEGENTIEITAESLEDTSETWKKQYTYTP